MSHRSAAVGRLAACALTTMATLGSSAVLISCAVRFHPAGDAPPAGAIACSDSGQCPYPDNACLLASCMDGQCVQVAAPQGTLPDSDQQPGDCRQRYCDGHGQVAAYPAPADLPADDRNQCTEARCDVDRPVQTPRPAGSSCGERGICNGAGACGVCLPGKEICRGTAVVKCSKAGQWSAPNRCAPPQPVCAAARCIGPVQIAAAGAHACARFDDGTVRCWGAGPGPAPAAAQAPPWASTVVAPQIGRRHACGLRGDGAAQCWGAGDRGQLGDGSYHSSATPVTAQVTDVVAMAVGANHSCARRRDGSVWCWGAGDHGQLGRGKPPSEPLTTPLPPRWSAPHPSPAPVAALSQATGLLLGADTSCALTAAGPRCLGLRPFALPDPIDEPPRTGGGPNDNAAREAYGKLRAASDPTPTAVPGLGDAQQLDCGTSSCCARRGDGSVWCWGANDRGQLGRGPGTDGFKAAAVPGVAHARQVVVGGGFACVVDATAKLRCWGDNRHGQLGRGTPDETGKPGVVPLDAEVRNVALGDDFACALLDGGTIRCWGAGALGQLGRGQRGDAPRPGAVKW